jgi:hypothetical protein
MADPQAHPAAVRVRSTRAALLALLTLTLAAVATAAPAPAGPAAPPPPPRPELEQLLERLQDAHSRALALGHILTDAKLVEQIRSRKAVDRRQLEAQVPALAQRHQALASAAVDRISASLRDGDAGPLAAAVAVLETKAFPETQAFVDLAKTLRVRLQYEATRPEGHPLSGAMLEHARALSRFIAARKADAGRDPSQRVQSMVRGMPLDAFWNWFASDGMSANQDTPGTVEHAGKLDLNRATEEQIRELPGIGPALARQIVELRASQGLLNGMDDLEHLPGFGQATRRKLETVAFFGDVRRPEGEWTVLVYSAFANDLEGKGIAELNRMEQVGSGRDVTIVNQLARIDGGKFEKLAAGDDRRDGNWASVRRYLVVRDDDPKRVGSRLVGKLGTVDSGDPRTLVDFCRWAIDLFPARHYWLVIRNHGSGSLGGIAADDGTASSISTPELAKALADVNACIRERSGRPEARLDIVNLQACVMATLEVVHELRDQTAVLVASEANSTGLFEWHRHLADLTAAPRMSAADLARRVARNRLEGILALKERSPDADLTLSAFDTARLAPLTSAVDGLGRALIAALPAESVAYTEAVTRSASYHKGSYVDLDGFCEVLADRSTDPALAAAARDVRDCLGYGSAPAPDAGPVRGVRIVSDRPGDAVWGINRWAGVPPRELAPPGSRAYLTAGTMRTPLSGPASDGRYEVRFPEFDPARLGVREIDYRIMGPRGGLGPEQRIRRFHPRDGFMHRTEFGPRSPLLVEVHTGGFAAARGVSMVLPVPVDPVRQRALQERYAGLAWGRETCWGQVIDHIGRTLMPARWQ